MPFRIRVPEPALKEVRRGRVVGEEKVPGLPFKLVVIESVNDVIEYVDASGRLRKFCLLRGRVYSCS